MEAKILRIEFSILNAPSRGLYGTLIMFVEKGPCGFLATMYYLYEYLILFRPEAIMSQSFSRAPRKAVDLDHMI